MPLSVNVGLSRKASKDYQSTGYSINVTAELDQSLLARPADLQQQVDDLFAQAQSALDRQAGVAQPSPQRSTRGAGGYNGRPSGNGNGHPANGNGSTMTESQRRAILSIAKRASADAEAEARDIIGVEMDELTLRQASELIDHLKALQPVGGNGHNGRN